MQVRNIFYDRIDTAPSLCLGSDKYHTLAMIRNPASYLWDGGRESSEKDAVVFLLPGQQIEIVRSSESFVYELVEFIPENWECDIPASLRLPAPVNFPSAVIHLSASVKLMYDTFYSADNFRLEKICHYVMLVLYGCADGDVRIQNASKQELLQHKLRRLRAMLSDYPTKSWSIGEGARIVGLSISRFAAVYKKQFGLTFMQDVIKARIRHSRTLLLTTDLSVEQIASELGYNTVKLFYLQFKNEMGRTPAEYRKFNVQAI
ncbi:MAG: helix-turn-helix transcriptional regulator [Oscillospiraceae bacterium]|nr:helix-turn-helix transcriptional regulator [Oscillospiraceae bacterium]